MRSSCRENQIKYMEIKALAFVNYRVLGGFKMQKVATSTQV